MNPDPWTASVSLLSGTGIAILLIGVERGASAGWLNPAALALVALGAALLVAFVRHALTVHDPLIEIRIYANRVFAVGMVAVGLLAVAQYTRLVYIPLELGTLRGISEFRIGLTMLPSALGIAIALPIGGRLTDRIGARVPVSIGVAVLGCTFLALANLTATTSLPAVAAILFIGGLGSGLAMMAPNIVAMNSVAATKVSQATALSQVSRQMAAAVGISVIAAIFATTRPDVAPGAIPASEALAPYRTVFLVAAGITAVVVVIAQFLPGKGEALDLQEQRQVELESLGMAVPEPASALTDH